MPAPPEVKVRGRRGRSEGYVDVGALHRALVTSFADALRSGIPVERLDLGRLPRAHVGAAPLALPGERELEMRIAGLSAEVDACFLKQARAVAGSSEEADLRAQGIAMKAALASAEAELAQLRRGPAKDVPPVEGPPRLVLAALKRALEILLLDGGRITNQQAAALDVVLADLVLEPGEGVWRCQASWRVPMTDGVALLGPVPFTVAMPAQRTTAVVRRNLGQVSADDRSAARDVALLMQLGLSKNAADTALDSPFPLLVPALVHALGGKPLPPDTAPAWQQLAFLAWLKRVYTDPQFKWSQGYTVVPFTEQSIVNAVVGRGGKANGRHICESMPRMTNPRLLRTVKKAMRIWNGAACEAPMVSYRRQSKKGDRGRGGRYALFTCDCRTPITTVVCAPEVPRRLLCKCGQMPDAQLWAMDPLVRFPPEYRSLSPSREQVEAYQQRDRGRSDAIRIGPTARLVLGLAGLRHPQEMSTTQISVALERSVYQAQDTLRRMEASGLITSRQPDNTGMVGRPPQMWTVHGDALAGKKVLSMGNWDCG